MKSMHFAVSIKTPREKVWSAMLSPDTFREWTAPFMPGSWYEGSWEEGSKIRFLGPGGDGMTSVIAANRPPEFVSIKHLGFVKNFVEDTESAAVKSWAPAFENYTLSESDGVTEVRVDLDAMPEFEQMFKEIWPKALAELKRICEKT